MTWDEFCDILQEPIEGKHNLSTEMARLVTFSYALSTVVTELTKENEELKNRLFKLEDYVVEQLHHKAENE